jgi:cell division protein FtsW (lipid II flippase)
LNLPFKADPRRSVERRLLRLAGFFLFLYAAALTLAPAARLHSWQAPYSWLHWLGWLAWLSGYWLIYRHLDRRLPNHDPYILPLVALLSGWGLLTVWRLDAALGMRQTLWLILSFLILFFAVRYIDLLRILRRYKYIWLSTGLLLTVLTFFFGIYPGGDGPRLWLGCCGVYFQPSEPLKLLLIAYLAAYLADQMPLKWSLPQLTAPTLIVASAATALLIAQRDLGTASLLIVLYTLIIFMASGRRRILGIAAAVILAAGVAGYAVFDVIRLRVDAWLNPWLDPYGESYQIVQSLISVATGRVFGTGPGLGSPNLVPVATSDFIGTAIAEETGLLGLSALILLFSMLFLRGLVIAINARASYQRFLASGLSAYFATQAIFILGGNLRLLPLTGVTLPFVSYGGSSLITAVFSVALLLIISGEQLDAQPGPVKPAPYITTASLMLTGFLALSLLAGWWGVIRSENLQFRPDNLRWTIHERYVPRGRLLDRNNQPIAVSDGKPGEFTRVLLYPDLANTIGYNHPRFGKSGLEASLDAYLTGLKGNPSSVIWLNEWIYSQPPPGLEVRLSLDLTVQTVADDLLTDRVGALVLINAESGEILALASHPTFDPNRMDENWDSWNSDPTAPLINRVTQGSYPAGAALGPFFFAVVSSSGSLPSVPGQLIANAAGALMPCALLPENGEQWGAVIRAGCPGPVSELISITQPEQISSLFEALGFYDTPQIELPVSEPLTAPNLTDLTESFILGDGLRISPLQMALAAAALSNQGQKPVPRLATAVLTPHQGWVVLPTSLPTKTLNLSRPDEIVNALAAPGSPYWTTTAQTSTAGGVLTWFIGGTISRWQGAPLAIALVLEEDDPELARAIGESVLQAAMGQH